MWSMPLVCDEHGGDAGLTREGLSRCPSCRAVQCGVGLGITHGTGRRRVEQRCPLPVNHGHYSSQAPAVTERVAVGLWSPTAIVEQLDPREEP